jgi:hypothetical protein
VSRLAVTITAEQARRLDALREQSGFTLDEQIGAMIDLDFEEWQDALDAAEMPTLPRSTRWLRFVASEGGAS